MTNVSEPFPAPPSRLRRLAPALLAAGALAVGGASSFAGLWSPLSLIGNGGPKVPEDSPAASEVRFVEMPRIVLSLPGEQPRTLAMAVLIDVDPASAPLARQLTPRLSDAFNGFLSDIDPAAFQRRGILEIIRAELATRARFILGDDALRDLLITEFRYQ